MIFIPLGYTVPGGLQFQLDTPEGGSPYGAGTLASSTGTRQPSEIELASARHQVRRRQSPSANASVQGRYTVHLKVFNCSRVYWVQQELLLWWS